MNSREEKKSIVIDNSPIEFVITGPKGKRDGILVKSKNAQLDLIGFAGNAHMKMDHKCLEISNSLWKAPRTLNSAESFRLDHRNDDWDIRKSGYHFFWSGLCSQPEREKIRDIFNRYVADMQSGIEEHDVDLIEWSLSPIVAKCFFTHINNEKRSRIKNIVSAIAVSASLFLLIRFYFIFLSL